MPFPIWSLCLYKNWIVLSGGGGGKKFGIVNMLMVYKPMTMEMLKQEDTGEDLATSIICVPKKDILITAISKDIMIVKISDSLEFQRLLRVPCDLLKNLAMVRCDSTEKKLVTGGEEGVLRLWNLETDRKVSKRLEIFANCEISGCDVNSAFVCAALKNKSCAIYSAETGAKLKSLQFGEAITNPMMFKACYFNSNFLYTLETGVKSGSYLTKWKIGSEIAPVDSLQVSEGAASYLKLSQSGKFAGIGSSNGTVSVVDLKNLKIVLQKAEFDMPATCLDFNSKETFILVGSADYSYSYIHLHSSSWVHLFLIGLFLGIFAYFSPFA